MILQRVLSSVLSCLTIISVYFLCKRFFDYPFPVIGSVIFAFEPRIILNSILGIAEPLFILLTTSAIVAILSSKKYMNYIAFILASLSTLVRSEGLILFLVFSILFLIINRKNKKSLLHYPILCLIFILILIPIAAYKIEVTDHDGFLSRIISEVDQTSSRNEEIRLDFFSNYFERIEKFSKMYGWSLIPTFILIVPYGIFFIIRRHDFDDFVIMMLLGIMMIPVVYSLSFLPDPRYSYFTFPILIVISLFTIKNISKKFKNRSLFLITVIGIVLISSSIFIELKRIDASHENEAFELTHEIAESAKVINQYLPESGFIPIVGLDKLEDFPVLRKDFEHNSGMEYCVDVHVCRYIIPINSDKIKDFIKYGKDKGLTHLIVDDNENFQNRAIFLKDVFTNEQNYPFLIKEYDSKENGFKYHVKIFKINYDEFNEFYKNDLKEN